MSISVKREGSEQETSQTQDEDEDHSTVVKVDPQSRKSVRRSVILQRQDGMYFEVTVNNRFVLYISLQ